MNKLNIAILYGGESQEHTVSSISANSIYKHINRDKYIVHLIGITKKGCWFYQPNVKTKNGSIQIIEDEKNLVSTIPGRGLFLEKTKLNIDFIFPILHGTFGEDGTVQGLIELLHLPYAGSSVIGSSVGMDKIIAKRVWDNCGIPIVPFYELNKIDLNSDNLIKADILNDLEKKLNYPLFVKPVNAGSSVGASKAINKTELIKAIKLSFKFDNRIIVENYINPREIECAVIGNENPKAFFPGEIISTHEFYDYDAKYNDPAGALLNTHADISKEIAKNIINYAITAYKSIMSEGFARVDFFIDKDSGAIFINEINTIPGFTNVSMFPKMCESAGIEYSILIDKIIGYGLERFNKKLSI